MAKKGKRKFERCCYNCKYRWLDLSCTEYEIPSGKFKDGDKVEVIIRKTQKGE